MVDAYLDSSATVKLFLDDEGDDHDVRLVIGASGVVVTSRLTFVETAAALAAARRSGRISADDHGLAMADFDLTWAAMEIVEITDQVARDAAEVADTFGLRAGDAIQLASVRRIATASTVLIAWDGRLRDAAIASGIACYPPAA